MDRPVIAQKLESLRRCLLRVKKKCPIEPESLIKDPDIQDILVLNLTRAVQICVDLGTHIISRMEVNPPNTMGETFDILAAAGVIPKRLSSQLKKAVGFRNIAIHHYEEIDWLIVHSIALKFLDDFKEFAERIAERLE